MLVKGTHTQKIVETLDVEVDPSTFLDDLYWRATPKPKEAAYIKDGYWYVFDYHDYHKGYDVQKKDREATKEELELYEAYTIMRNAIKYYNV